MALTNIFMNIQLRCYEVDTFLFSYPFCPDRPAQKHIVHLAIKIFKKTHHDFLGYLEEFTTEIMRQFYHYQPINKITGYP